MSDDLRWYRLALHESGHATVAAALGVQVAHCRIDRDLGMGFTPTRRTDAWTEALICFGGTAAVPGSMSEPDLQTALEVVAPPRKEPWARALAEAKSILAQHLDALLDVAAELHETGYVDGERVLEIVTI